MVQNYILETALLQGNLQDVISHGNAITCVFLHGDHFMETAVVIFAKATTH